jgi:hypothetical protein
MLAEWRNVHMATSACYSSLDVRGPLQLSDIWQIELTSCFCCCTAGGVGGALLPLLGEGWGRWGERLNCCSFMGVGVVDVVL